ncbi:MAG: hypothetical protein LRZ98_00465 [Candidatus Pacebacteria bacterium]|nr:hypothetical protein [Candidatus Paceibacterota bacterium]
MKILNLKKKINFSFLFLVFFFFLIVSFSLATEGILLEDFGGRLSNVEGMIQNDPSAALAAYINFLVNMAFGLLSIAAVILII